MQEPVQDGRGEHFVPGQHFRPDANALVGGGDQNAAASVAVGDQPKKRLASSRLSGWSRIGRGRVLWISLAPFPSTILRTGRARLRTSGSLRLPMSPDKSLLKPLQVEKVVPLALGKAANRPEFVRLHPAALLREVTPEPQCSVEALRDPAQLLVQLSVSSDAYFHDLRGRLLLRPRP